MTDEELAADVAVRCMIATARHNPERCGRAIAYSLAEQFRGAQGEQAISVISALLTALLDKVPELSEIVDVDLRKRLRGWADGRTSKLRPS